MSVRPMKQKMCRNDICCDLRSIKTTADGITTCLPQLTNGNDQFAEPEPLSHPPIEDLTKNQKHELQGGLVDVMGPNKRNISGTNIPQNFA